MAEGQFWRMFHSLDSRQGTSGVCGVCAEVRTASQFPRNGSGSPEEAGEILSSLIFQKRIPYLFIYIQSKKLRETLNELYIHLDSAAALGGSEDLPTGLAGFGQGEYYPYVYYKINIDMVGPGSSNI